MPLDIRKSESMDTRDPEFSCQDYLIVETYILQNNVCLEQDAMFFTFYRANSLSELEVIIIFGMPHFS